MSGKEGKKRWGGRNQVKKAIIGEGAEGGGGKESDRGIVCGSRE